MVDRFHGLRHDTVIRCHDKDSDIRGIGASHTHGCKCFMARCIKECDRAVIVMDHGCTDMLCNAAGFFIRYMCIADRVQERSLTMVNMSHDTDNGRSGNQICLIFIIFFQKICDQILLLLMFAENIIINCDLFCFFIRQILVQRDHLAGHEQLLDDGGSLDLHLIRKFLQGDGIRKDDRLDLFLDNRDRFGFMECPCTVRVFLAASGLYPVGFIETIVFLAPVLALSSAGSTVIPVSVPVLIVILASLGRSSAPCAGFAACHGNCLACRHTCRRSSPLTCIVSSLEAALSRSLTLGLSSSGTIALVQTAAVGRYS